MNDLASAFSDAIYDLLIAEPGDSMGVSWDGLYLDRNQVNIDRVIIHFANRTREVTNADIDRMRSVLVEHGYREVNSWVCYQGQSWLSDGVFVGVSFEVKKMTA